MARVVRAAANGAHVTKLACGVITPLFEIEVAAWGRCRSKRRLGELPGVRPKPPLSVRYEALSVSHEPLSVRWRNVGHKLRQKLTPTHVGMVSFQEAELPVICHGVFSLRIQVFCHLEVSEQALGLARVRL